MIFVQNSDAVEAGLANSLYRGGKGFRYFPMTGQLVNSIARI